MVIFEIFNYFPENFPLMATLISGFVAFVLGIIWYNPKLIGEKAQEALDDQLRGYSPGVTAYVTALVLWVMCSFIYSFLTSFLTPPTIQSLLGLSTFIWIGFILPAIMVNGLFQGRKLVVMGLDSSYFLAGLYVFAVIHDVLA